MAAKEPAPKKEKEINFVHQAEIRTESIKKERKYEGKNFKCKPLYFYLSRIAIRILNFFFRFLCKNSIQIVFSFTILYPRFTSS